MVLNIGKSSNFSHINLLNCFIIHKYQTTVRVLENHFN